MVASLLQTLKLHFIKCPHEILLLCQRIVGYKIREIDHFSIATDNIITVAIKAIKVVS